MTNRFLKRVIPVFVILLITSLGIAGCSANNKNELVDEVEPVEVSSEVEAIVSGMSLEEKIEQMLVLAFRTWGEGDNQVPLTELNDGIEESIKNHSFGGVILFSENIETNKQTFDLIKAMKDANDSGNSKTKLFVAVDQEGGTVTRLTSGTQLPGNMALAATGDPENARKAASIIGEELSCLGFNVNFAPTLDVNNNPRNPIIGVRSFSDDPAIVSKFGSAFIAGLHDKNILCSLKHFPGHGDTDVDSHTGLPQVDKSLDEIRQYELAGFKDCLKDADMVMSAHIVFPQIESETYLSKSDNQEINLPATLSRTIITDVLRGELEYDGVVVTDALDMGAIADNFDPMDSARLAINAGVDILLMPVAATNDKGLAELDNYVRGIADQVKKGDISEDTINRAVSRIISLKEKYGLLMDVESGEGETTINEVQEFVGDSENSPGSLKHHDLEWEIALKAITMIKNDGDLIPLKAGIDDGEEIVILVPFGSELYTAKAGVDQLFLDGIVPEEMRDSIEVVVYDGKQPTEAEALVSGKKIAILVSSLYGPGELNPDTEEGIYTAFVKKAIEAIHNTDGKAVVLSARLPYDIAAYPDADAILACYNDRGVGGVEGTDASNYNIKESNPWGKEYGPNIPAAIYAMFGGAPITGKLPVNIPAINEDYSLSDEILYENSIE